MERLSFEMNGGECAICYEKIEDVKSLDRLGCEHVFHIECISEWLDVSPTCPICRCDVDGLHKEFPCDGCGTMVVFKDTIYGSAIYSDYYDMVFCNTECERSIISEFYIEGVLGELMGLFKK